MSGKAFQHVLDNAPRGQPLDSAMLRELGVSSALASYWVRAGWLLRLSKGAYLARGDTPTSNGIIAYLSRRVPGLHVGGKTALDWQGCGTTLHSGRASCCGDKRRTDFPSGFRRMSRTHTRRHSYSPKAFRTKRGSSHYRMRTPAFWCPCPSERYLNSLVM